LHAPIGEEPVASEEESIGALARKAGKGRIDLGDRRGIEDLEFQPTGCEEHVEICYRSRACGLHVKNIGWRRSVMHAVVRNYSGKGTKALFDLLEKNKGEVESLIRGVKSFVSYSLVRTTRGGFSVSVYQDKAGADESTRAAREWIAKNASKTGVARPTRRQLAFAVSRRHQ
jgi:hypothetical protein